MDKQDLIKIIDTIQTLRQVNTELMEEHAKIALERDGAHNIYTELRDWHQGKVTAYDQVLELLEA